MINIMMADDDEDDRLMFKEAVEETRLICELKFAVDGEDLLNQIRGVPGEELPDLILLDLNMPRKSGTEVLQEIRQDPRLKTIPIVILTTSSAEQDIIKSYQSGANSFVSKPVTFDGLREKILSLTDYWFDVVKLPGKEV